MFKQRLFGYFASIRRWKGCCSTFKEVPDFCGLMSSLLTMYWRRQPYLSCSTSCRYDGCFLVVMFVMVAVKP
jgi:hypothetical protein